MSVIIVVKNINVFSPSQVLVVSEIFIFLFKEKTVERKYKFIFLLEDKHAQNFESKMI